MARPADLPDNDSEPAEGEEEEENDDDGGDSDGGDGDDQDQNGGFGPLEAAALLQEAAPDVADQHPPAVGAHSSEANNPSQSSSSSSSSSSDSESSQQRPAKRQRQHGSHQWGPFVLSFRPSTDIAKKSAWQATCHKHEPSKTLRVIPRVLEQGHLRQLTGITTRLKANECYAF